MILTTCKYFDLVGNRCSRVTDGKCNDLQNCEFKYIEELKAENEKLTSWLASSEKQKTELCNVIHKKKEQIQTMKYMLFDEKEIPKDKFTMYYRIAQNERRTKSHRDLCTNIVKKYRKTLQEIKAIAEKECKDCINRRTDSCWICPYYPILELITKAEKE